RALSSQAVPRALAWVEDRRPPAWKKSADVTMLTKRQRRDGLKGLVCHRASRRFAGAVLRSQCMATVHSAAAGAPNDPLAPLLGYQLRRASNALLGTLTPSLAEFGLSVGEA